MSVVVRLLGHVDVTVDGSPRPVPGLRRKAVLARLALRLGEVVSADQLIDAVWDGKPPTTAVNSLQSHVSALRRLLGVPDAIRAQAPGYVLGAVTTDLRLSEGLVARGRDAASPADRLAALEQALDLWRGQPLVDVARLSWFSDEAPRLERARRSAERAAVECRLVLGQHAALVPELTRLCELHPFDEEQHGHLMLALYRCGRQAEALAVFHRLRARLGDELGIDPGGPARDLQAAILRQDPGLAHAPSPERSGAPAGAGTPPTGRARATRLVERAEEIALLDRALAEVQVSRAGRILIFEGSGGAGKTSLLDHARRRAAERGLAVMSARGSDLETDHDWGCVRQLFPGQAGVELDAAAGPLSDREAPGGYRTIASLYERTRDLAVRSPLVITFDDLHWADTPSARFLAFLAARLDASPTVLVVGLRPGHERVGRFLASIAGLPYATSRVLRPLGRDGCAQLLTDTLDAVPDEEVVDRCQALTRGNPFLMRELASRLSAVAGDVERALSDCGPGLRRFVSRQFRCLPPESAELARVLAVLGDGAGCDWLAKAARMTPREALDALDPLVSGQLVVAEGAPVRFSFEHPMIRDSVYDSIPSRQRAELHLRAAQVALGGHHSMTAATHLLRVPPGFGDLDPLTVLSEAADLSLSRGLARTAVSFLRRILEEDLADRRAEMMARLGAAEALVDGRATVEPRSHTRFRAQGPDRSGRTFDGQASALRATGVTQGRRTGPPGPHPTVVRGSPRTAGGSPRATSPQWRTGSATAPVSRRPGRTSVPHQDRLSGA
ncbi:AAA family ATPase [Frankia sp. CNm7]|uniref:AAA family ATPase n=1 Tax=Frankia nepalensis TaxID=1836974 RepID=A0A937UR87_9ACTN|nr:BTAD domain-containing putative transcriptional regulator [Frankia nepalensis]MBL7500256.1 AAA family ATPase [Frankia nepalensis]MBL7513532.1 AAA family ATPase [Frankia nepalensis]MBL7519878.1 AAA family ATPase [Frankia nepalensis]MBL7628995.1 AAA family ATPase [Frankia nepalensis]